ncbi:MAG: VWA domain-containing protein [Deltaproteobacteria bacterium]|nr:MAG: VWA domain-containing protein [Deltaproteobacteria bacterium]
MSLSMLLPGALALAALIALPILAHIARQRPRERVPFGAMLLLRRVVKRLRRRRRVKDPLLLLLRIAFLMLLVFAATGLRFSYDGGAPEFGGTGKVVVLFDRSMSMSMMHGGSTVLSRTRGEARELIDSLPPGTQVGLIAFDDEATALTSGLVTDHAQVRSRIGVIEPSLGGSNLRAALIEARRMLEGEPGEILLFSDEAGPRMVSEASDELRRVIDQGSAVLSKRPEAVPRNVAVTAARYGDGIEGGTVELLVSNFGDQPIEVPCEVRLPDGQVVPIFADLPPEGESLERVTVPRQAEGGVGEAWCDDPDLPADDARYFHLPQVGASRVLVVDGDPGETPIRSEVYFVERALAPWGAGRSGVTPDVVTPLGLLDLDPQTHQVVFLANVGDPRPFAAKLAEFVQKGGSLVISAGSNVSAERYNSALSGLLPAPLRRAEDLAGRGEPGVALLTPDPSLELFEPFARSGRTAFSEVASRRVVLLEPYSEGSQARTLLRYEGGIPALVEREVGKGRVMLWTSTFDYDWSNLPTQAVFMPMIQRIVAYLGGQSSGAGARFEADVGRPVAIELPDLAIDPQVFGPDSQPVPSRIEGTKLIFTPSRPGAYELRVDASPPLAWVAANLDPTESDVRVYETVMEAEARIAPERFLRHVDLSPWLLGGALLLALMIALLALRGRAT